ncbi:hypothetical protein [Bacillus sp. JJ1562]|uniref:hypothetical protein n=1 Tax=Bacillus sp. JJ1562 TaxID=3122960 RepID=UPI003002D3AE
MDMLKDFFNPYERTARLYPALIILIPTFVTVYCLFEDFRELLPMAMGSIFFLGFSYYIGKLAREIGKKKQDNLITLWDGMPSIRFLRHRDATIDPITKARYHHYLTTHIHNLKIPTPEEELANPKEADNIYASAVKWLLAKTRDTQKYSLLFRENISYGFMRNFWALKLRGVIINSIVLIATALLVYTRYSFDYKMIPPTVWLSVCVTAFVIIFILLITKETVHSKAKAYARTLLEVCDENDNNQ